MGIGELSSLVFALLTCLEIGFVLGDMKDPHRDLPRILHGFMIIVMISFTIVNVALYFCVSFQTMQTTPTAVVV